MSEWAKNRGCTSKVSYSTKKLAKSAVRSLGRGTSVRPYACTFCGLWHVGHPNPKFALIVPVVAE